MRDFLGDLIDACKGGSGNRGFWIFVTVALAVVTLLIPVLLVLNIIMLIKGWWQVLYLILFLVAVVLDALVIFIVNKLRD